MGKIIIKLNVPDEMEDFIKKEIKELIKKRKKIKNVLDRAKGCLKTEENWQKLEEEMYESIFRQ